MAHDQTAVDDLGNLSGVNPGDPGVECRIDRVQYAWQWPYPVVKEKKSAFFVYLGFQVGDLRQVVVDGVAVALAVPTVERGVTAINLLRHRPGVHMTSRAYVSRAIFSRVLDEEFRLFATIENSPRRCRGGSSLV